MATHSNPSEQPEDSGNRKKLVADELGSVQSMQIPNQLPKLIVVNGLWALVCFFVVGRYGSWPLLIPSLTAILIVLALTRHESIDFLRLTFSSIWPESRRFTVYVGLLGFSWGVTILTYLPNLPITTFCLLMIGCLILMYWVAGELYKTPAAGILYIVPISLAGLYVASPPHGDTRQLLMIFIVLVTGGSMWTLMKRWEFFLRYIDLSIEKDYFSDASKVAVVSRNQFLENVSHEIRTPLTAILGYTRLLAAGKYKIPSIHDKTLDHLEVSALTLLRSIDVLLDAAKLNAGKLELQENIIDIRSIVLKTVALVRRSAEIKNIDIGISFGSDVPREVSGDSDRVYQIICNLLENAVKFTESGHIRVNVSCNYSSASLGKEKGLCIAVTDTGVGIDASKHSLVFQSFYQADGSVTRRHGGMGLGLTVSKMLANLMEGDLNFESDGHSGSTFICWLPIRAKIQDVSEKMSSMLGSKNHDEDWSVLIVDDDVYIRHYLQVLLSASGWIVDICESGFSAIAKCLERKYSLILMDIQMPVMTGIDASKVIWSNPLNDRTPILVMTGYLSTDRIIELQSAGLHHYLGKPLVPEELLLRAKHAVLSSFNTVAAKPQVVN